MTESGYREFIDSEYTRLRKGLLAHKGSDRQEEFLETARSSRGLLTTFRQRGHTRRG